MWSVVTMDNKLEHKNLMQMNYYNQMTIEAKLKCLKNLNKGCDSRAKCKG